MSPTRTCGNCIACCTYLSCKEVPMEGLTVCVHSLTVEGELPMNGVHDLDQHSEGNCTIYKERPPACQGYSCMWLDGFGYDEDRPDRSGMLCDNVKRIHNSFQAKPLWEGAQDTVQGQEAVRRISEESGLPGLVASYPEARMVRVVGRGLE